MNLVIDDLDADAETADAVQRVLDEVVRDDFLERFEAELHGDFEGRDVPAFELRAAFGEDGGELVVVAQSDAVFPGDQTDVLDEFAVERLADAGELGLHLLHPRVAFQADGFFLQLELLLVGDVRVVVSLGRLVLRLEARRQGEAEGGVFELIFEVAVEAQALVVDLQDDVFAELVHLVQDVVCGQLGGVALADLDVHLHVADLRELLVDLVALEQVLQREHVFEVALRGVDVVQVDAPQVLPQQAHELRVPAGHRFFEFFLLVEVVLHAVACCGGVGVLPVLFEELLGVLEVFARDAVEGAQGVLLAEDDEDEAGLVGRAHVVFVAVVFDPADDHLQLALALVDALGEGLVFEEVFAEAQEVLDERDEVRDRDALEVVADLHRVLADGLRLHVADVAAEAVVAGFHELVG